MWELFTNYGQQPQRGSLGVSCPELKKTEKKRKKTGGQEHRGELKHW